MTVYVDVSEARAMSRLHPKLSKTAEKIVGLEAATGADILVSAAEGKLPGNVNRPPGSILLAKHIQSGLLIQRKSGSDMLSSIPNLHNLIARMRATDAKMCWLLITGYFFRKPENNMVKCEGRDYGWRWEAYQAAIDAWQILGGYTHTEPDDLTAVDWIIAWDKKLPMILKEVEQGLAEKPVTPKLGVIDPHPERVTLMSFPGCGDSISLKIMDRFPTLAGALEWMSQPPKMADSMYGVGEETIKAWRRWLGLEDGEVLSRFLLGGPTVHGDEPGVSDNSDRANGRSGEGKLDSERKAGLAGSALTDFDGSREIPKRENRYGS